MITKAVIPAAGLGDAHRVSVARHNNGIARRRVHGECPFDFLDDEVGRDLARGTSLLALGTAVMALNCLLGLDDHLHIAGAETFLAHLGRIHDATIIFALLLFAAGFLSVYRTAIKVAKR